MKRFSKQGKSKPKSIVATQKQFLQGIVLLICISLIIVFIFGDHGLLKLYTIKKKRKETQESIAKLREEKEKIIDEKSKMENNLDYIEKIAREKYKMVKPGEKLFKVIEN